MQQWCCALIGIRLTLGSPNSNVHPKKWLWRLWKSGRRSMWIAWLCLLRCWNIRGRYLVHYLLWPSTKLSGMSFSVVLWLMRAFIHNSKNFWCKQRGELSMHVWFEFLRVTWWGTALLKPSTYGQLSALRNNIFSKRLQNMYSRLLSIHFVLNSWNLLGRCRGALLWLGSILHWLDKIM